MEKEMTFWEHLGELRIRLVRCALYVVIGATMGWYTFPFVDHLLVKPAEALFQSHHIPFIYNSFTGAFFLRFQVALVTGVAYSLPLITLEAWGFISPALLPHEKKWVHFVAPLSILFFALGITAGYLVMQPAIAWFLGYVPPGQQVLQNAQDFILFEVKCILAFGLVFQLPVVLMFLAVVRVVNSEMLKKQWRYAICLLTIVGAVVTPSNDPATMIAMTLPLIALYGISIFLVAITEKMCGRGPMVKPTPGDDPLQSG